MNGYRKKDAQTLAYDEGVKRIRQEVRLIEARILNEVIDAWSKECLEAQELGMVVELKDPAAVRNLIRGNVRKALKA